MAHTLQARYSKLILAKLRKELVTKDNLIFNTDYEGDPKAGVVKIPVRDTEVAIGDYNKATGLTLGTGATTYLDMTINKDKGVNEICDGYDALAVPDGLLAERLDSAAYSLYNQVDADSIHTLENEGTVATSVAALTSSTAYDALVLAKKTLSKANVPANGRFLIVSPDMEAYLESDTTHFIRASALGDEVIQSGAIGKILGMLVYSSNQMMVSDTTFVSGKSTTTEFIAGHSKWCHRAMEFKKDVGIVNLTNEFIGSSAVQGRFVYGTKVSRAAAVYVKTVQV